MGRVETAESGALPLLERAAVVRRVDDLPPGAAFERLAREHADMLTSYLRCLVRSSDVVDDLFQDTMLTAWRRLGDYDEARPFGPWLRGIAARLVRKHRSRSARDVLNCEPEVLAALERRFDASLDDDGGFGGLVERLRACLARLPVAMRRVVGLFYESGLALARIAVEVDASEEAVKKRLQRSRAQLAACLQVQEGRR